MIHFLLQLHKDIFLLMHGFVLKNPKLHSIIYYIAERLDNYVVVLGLMLFIYFFYQSIEHISWKRFAFISREVVQSFVAIGISWWLSYLIKAITHIPRPYLRFPDEVVRLFDYGGFDSFPSGHATLFMALAVMMSLHHRRVGYLFLFFAIIIPIARIVSGIHTPIDVLVGWSIGALLSLFIYKNLKFK